MKSHLNQIHIKNSDAIEDRQVGNRNILATEVRRCTQNVLQLVHHLVDLFTLCCCQLGDAFPNDIFLEARNLPITKFAKFVPSTYNRVLIPSGHNVSGIEIQTLVHNRSFPRVSWIQRGSRLQIREVAGDSAAFG